MSFDHSYGDHIVLFGMEKFWGRVIHALNKRMGGGDGHGVGDGNMSTP